MTDCEEISKALALAVGWPQATIYGSLGCMVSNGAGWRSFDYRDWNIIGPIAEKFDCFPSVAACNGDKWFAYTPGDSLTEIYADTPQKAIALAVIQGAKK